jgi:2'-deoxynucleoside 5'-phosphate N-hydrolase
MKIYFAGSIRGGRDDKALYAKIISVLGKYGTVLTEHVGNSDLTERGEDGSSEDIFKRDMSLLEKADCIVAEVTTPSLGVGYELRVAETLGKAILCLFRESAGKNLSAMIAGNKKIKTAYYENLEEIPKILERFFTEHG